MATPTALYHMVGIALDALGVDSYSTRRDKDRWLIQWGSIRVAIQVLGVSEGLPPFLGLYACVMSASVQNPLALYRKLLELNHTLLGRMTFSIDLGEVWLLAGRLGDEVDGSKHLIALIKDVAEVADSFDDELIAEFGGALDDQS